MQAGSVSPPVPGWLGGPSTPHARPDTAKHPDGPAYSRPDGDWTKKRERRRIKEGGGVRMEKGGRREDAIMRAYNQSEDIHPFLPQSIPLNHDM